jgi:hypothetical protein
MGGEADDPNFQDMRTTMNMTNSRWGCHALTIGFAERQYPKGSNRPMISKSMMEHKSPSRGYQTTSRM